MSNNITVPEIGDFDSVEIIEVLVKVGDQIKKNDPKIKKLTTYFKTLLK